MHCFLYPNEFLHLPLQLCGKLGYGSIWTTWSIDTLSCLQAASRKCGKDVEACSTFWLSCWYDYQWKSVQIVLRCEREWRDQVEFFLQDSGHFLRDMDTLYCSSGQGLWLGLLVYFAGKAVDLILGVQAFYSYTAASWLNCNPQDIFYILPYWVPTLSY